MSFSVLFSWSKTRRDKTRHHYHEKSAIFSCISNCVADHADIPFCHTLTKIIIVTLILFQPQSFNNWHFVPNRLFLATRNSCGAPNFSSTTAQILTPSLSFSLWKRTSLYFRVFIHTMNVFNKIFIMLWSLCDVNWLNKLVVCCLVACLEKGLLQLLLACSPVHIILESKTDFLSKVFLSFINFYRNATKQYFLGHSENKILLEQSVALDLISSQPR